MSPDKASLPSMHCSVSRSVDDALRDPNWPGPDRRKWRQTTLWAQAPLPSPPSPPSPPHSPSLRLAPRKPIAAPLAAPGPRALPVVEPGQLRLTPLLRESLKKRARGARVHEVP